MDDFGVYCWQFEGWLHWELRAGTGDGQPAVLQLLGRCLNYTFFFAFATCFLLSFIGLATAIDGFTMFPPARSLIRCL